MNNKKRKSNAAIERHIHIRLYFILFVCIILLAFIGVYKVYAIKFIDGKEYEAEAIYNQVNKIQDKIINPNRGAILDRNKQAFAISSTVYNIILDVRILVEQDKEVQQRTLSGINEVLGISMEDLQEHISKKEDGKLKNDTNWLIIDREVPYNKGRELIEKNLKCVYTEEDTKRNYPHNNVAAQVIGFIRGDSVWGLERQYNDVMAGVPGRVFRTYESDNSIVTRQEPSQEGHSLITTLDQTIQQFTEDAVKNAYNSCLPDHKAANTAAIVMNPNTGEILAMAEYPNFNSNEPMELSVLEDAAYKTQWDSMTQEQKSVVTNTIWKNFNITDTFEPGSIFKPLVVGAAIEEGIISKNDTYYCSGNKTVEGQVIHCHLRSGHGSQTAEDVLANSCNVGMMDIGKKMGRELFYKYHRDFGFGEKTGIDLPGEASASETSGLMYALNQLNPVELATSSFGQGFNCTPIQAINGFAATINGGNLMRPYLVSQVIDQNGNIIEEHSPEVVRKVISTETSDYLRTSMQSVIKETGTGKKAIIDGYALGGKTGTAQQGDRNKKIYSLSFVAYLPVENPEYLAMLVIHHPEKYTDGIVSPVPTLRELLVNIINYKSIPPSHTTDETTSSANSNEVTIRDYVGKSLRETIKELNSLGVEFELAGAGGNIVTKQFPNANAKVDKNTKILIYISSSGDNPELVLVPEVVELPINQAIQVLESSGFEYNIVEESTEATTETATETESVETEVKEKAVYEQIPSSEVKIEKGSIIKLKVR